MSLLIIILTVSLISLAISVINTGLFITMLRHKTNDNNNGMVYMGPPFMSYNEQRAFEKLQQVKHESIWAAAIKNVVESKDVVRFRMLICDLKSQAHDNMVTMRNILGAEALQAVLKL